MRNNKQMLEDIKSKQEEIVKKVEKLSNTQQKFPSPTEFVVLPSQGFAYPKSSALYRRKSVEIKEMTTFEEDILVNSSYIKQGIVLTRFLEAMIIDRDFNVEELLPADFDAILVAARISGYGPDYEVQTTCPKCAHVSDYQYDARPFQEVLFQPDESNFSENGTFEVYIQRTDTVIECKLLTSKDQRELKELKEHKISKGFQETNRTDELFKIIVSINGDNSEETIRKFISTAKPMDTRFIRAKMAELEPKLNMKLNFECNNCKYQEKMEVPVTVKFFWP